MYTTGKLGVPAMLLLQDNLLYMHNMRQICLRYSIRWVDIMVLMLVVKMNWILRGHGTERRPILIPPPLL